MKKILQEGTTVQLCQMLLFGHMIITKNSLLDLEIQWSLVILLHRLTSVTNNPQSVT